MHGAPLQSAAVEHSPLCIPLDVDVDVAAVVLIALVVLLDVEPPEPVEAVAVSTVESHAARPSALTAMEAEAKSPKRGELRMAQSIGFRQACAAPGQISRRSSARR
jgi:hypothetical protein